MIGRFTLLAAFALATATSTLAQEHDPMPAESSAQDSGSDLEFLLGADSVPAPEPETPAVESLPEPYPDVVPAAEDDQPEPAMPPARPRSRLVEEIVVTAQKREENLQDVPISIQAFSAEMLDARGIADQRDLQQITPGLDVGSQVGYVTIYLRGVGSDAYLTADPSIASYIDGIYYPFSQGLAQDFGAVERVEILKGPQGTLFGRNAVGGAVHVITRSPSFTAPEVSILTSYGNFDSLKTRAYVNIPLADSLAVSVAALYNDGRYYMDGEADGKPLPKQIERGARLKVRWAPVDDIDLILTGFRLSTNGAGSMFQLNANPSVLGRTLGITAQDGYEGSVNAPTSHTMSNTVVYGQGTWYGPGVDLKILGSYQNIRIHAPYDFDGSSQPLFSMDADPTKSRVKTGELQLLSNDRSWGADWLQWIGGIYWFESVQGFDPVNFYVADIDLERSTVAGIPVPSGLVGLLDSLLGPVTGGIPTGGLELVAMMGTESLAGFSQATITFTDWISLTLGARYQSEERYVIESSVGLETTGGAIGPVINFRNARDSGTGRLVPLSTTTESFKPKVSLDLRPFDDDTLLYLTWQEALKSATYNVVALYLPPAYVKPEEIEAYEVGVKTALFGGSMRLNAAVFDYKLRNMQVQFVSLLQGGAVSFENAGAARVRGVDFDTTVELFPNLVNGLVFVGGAAYLDAKYTDYANGTGFTEEGFYSTNNDYTGNEVVRTPKFTATAGLSKTWTAPGGTLELAGDAYFNSGFHYAASNLERTWQPAYNIFGARVSYLYEPWQLRVTLFGRNIFDKKYTAGILANDFGNLVTLAPPVTYGVRLNWDF